MLWLRYLLHNPDGFKYYQMNRPSLASHRGYGKRGEYAENTLEAFKQSTVRGFNAHELDVRRTKDNFIVVFHGPGLESTTNGKGRLEDTLFKDAQKLNWAGYLENRSTGILTLESYLDNLGETVTTNIELKRDWHDLSRGLEKQVVKLVKDRNLQNKVFYSSFNWLSIWRLKQLKTGSAIGLLAEPSLFTTIVLFTGKMLLLPDLIHPPYQWLHKKRVRTLHHKGYGIATYTCNDKDKVKELFSYGTDVVITDNIDLIDVDFSQESQ